MTGINVAKKRDKDDKVGSKKISMTVGSVLAVAQNAAILGTEKIAPFNVSLNQFDKSNYFENNYIHKIIMLLLRF